MIALRVLRSGWLALVMWLCAALWWFLPPFIYHVEKVEIRGDEVVLSRSFPLSDRFGFPRPMIEYHETVQRLDVEGDDARPCTDSGYFRYVSTDRVGRWSLSPWSDRCRLQPYRWEANWTIRLWGQIPLRTITREVIALVPEVE